MRRLALKIDPANAPRLRLFAWNAFLGERTQARPIAARTRKITDLLSQADMETLTDVYYTKFDPCYGFVDRRDLEESITSRWMTHFYDEEMPRDAELCAIAAIGCLFSSVQPLMIESDAVESARTILERTKFDTPSLTSIRAWVLRVAYLRMTGKPHKAWMASCILMHMVEASGIHLESSKISVLDFPREDINADTRRRTVGVAQHLNTWMSFDLGRTRVVLHNATTTLPAPRPGNYTVELLELLPYSELLDPNNTLDVHELESALSQILARNHSDPPLIQAQCNLMLCICRRLQALNLTFSGERLEQILALTLKSIHASQSMVENVTPWHHMTNIPFQVVCMLLAIDTPASIAQLKDVMQCLSNIVSTYRTDATQEALRTASLLIQLHQKRKELDASNLNDILRLHQSGAGSDASLSNQQLLQVENMEWLDDFMAGIPSLQNVDLDQFLSTVSPFDMQSDGMLR